MVAFLANEKLCHNTIKGYLAAIRHLHIADGAGDPGISSMPRLEQVVKGVKATQAKEGKGHAPNHARATAKNEASLESREW